MKKTGNEYAILTPHGQAVMFCVPVVLIGLPVALGVSFIAPQLPLLFGLTGRHLPLIVFGGVMSCIAVAWWIEGVKLIFRDADWRSPKGIATSLALLLVMTVTIVCAFIGSFVPDDSSLSDARIGIGDLR